MQSLTVFDPEKVFTEVTKPKSYYSVAGGGIFNPFGVGSADTRWYLETT